jgi:SAM-dependent methyltransferase
MIEKSAGQSLLENAYKLSTPEDNVDYYDAFASTYDTDFADALGWHYPAAIAVAYRDAASKSDTPIADVGCGTGLVASALNLPREQVDGIDISAIVRCTRWISRRHWMKSQMTTGQFCPQELSHLDILVPNHLKVCSTSPAPTPYL